MQVRDLMKAPVLTAAPGDTAADVARTMEERKVGAVIVCEGKQVAGIFTDRDFLHVAAKRLDPTTAAVRDHMTAGIQSVSPRDDIAVACRRMVEGRFRHLPVVEKGDLVGMISMRDLLTWAAREMFAADELPRIEESQQLIGLAVEGNER